MDHMNRQRLEFAAVGFLAEMRRHFVKLNPDKENPVPSLEDYSPEHRAALFAGLQKAIQYAGPAGESLYAAWVARREEQQDQSAA